jgi:flagellar basal-body rod protein FlgB
MGLTTNVLGYALDALGQAEQVAAGNVANDQTPGYTAKTYNFDTALRAALASGGTATLTPTEGLSPAPAGTDGNNVDLAQQMTNLSEDQVQTQAVADALSTQFQILGDAMAASGGGTL